jgi:hypothetical protein
VRQTAPDAFPLAPSNVVRKSTLPAESVATRFGGGLGVLRQNPRRAVGSIAQGQGSPGGSVAVDIRVIRLIEQFPGGSCVFYPSDGARGATGVTISAIAYGKGILYVSDSARERALS